MSFWPTAKPLFGDEMVLRSIDWLENFPWRNEATIKKEKDKYSICLHAKDFSPDDITVKTADGFIVVEGKHEEKKDEDGYISRHFVRRYALPEGCKPESVESRLSSDGILTITAPRKPVVRRDTVIPVSHEGSVKSKL
ncbi:protein lethal(2)essential for life-like [Vanessa cardui]|uniref:protein lethal(2)essential for life-like n=1 Tax=Vanessa cardui TaxID=171605 RepID=UPI001F1469E2|nr:protein lethal(2)essential for life-like [Vanessa cardui]